ncbi:MAG: long-chain fatty acid--CoA ligase, partial [Terriglobales bacterium]
YADLYRRSRALAEALQKAGLKRGDRVATLMWNHHAHLEAYFGIPISGGVLHTLNLRLAPTEIAYIASHAQDRFLIVDDILLPLYEKIRDSVTFERVIVVRWSSANAAPRKPSEQISESRSVHKSDSASSSSLKAPNSKLTLLPEDYEEFLRTASGNFQYPGLDENEAASLCYTSGTTGIPKGVAYTHRSVMLHTFLLTTVDNFGICNADSVLPIVSMFHVNGWGLSYAATLVGAKQVLPGPHLKPDSLLELCENENVTVAAGVPTVWHSIFEHLDRNPGRKLRPMRVLIGGAAPSLALIQKLHKSNCTLAQGWGLTESSPQATTNQLKAHMKNWSEENQNEVRAQAGLPVPFIERRVVTGQGENPFEEVPWDGQTMGEVQLRGPWVAASYYNLPAENDKWTEDGWFRTSDVGTVNAEGYLRIVDRTKDLIKSGGEWISSVDLENALLAHPQIREAAVVAVAHPKWQERPVAIVVAHEGPRPSPEALRDFLSPKFAKWQLPDAFVFVEELPHTSTGKLLKAELRRRFQNWAWEPQE